VSFFFDSDPQSIVDALAVGDFDTAGLLMGDQQASIEDFLANQTFVTVTGTTDGAGAATLAHGLDLTNKTVMLCQGWYDAGSTQSKPLTITYVDATNVVVSGGGATKACRVTLVVAVGLITF
jgi:hypothetical protein